MTWIFVEATATSGLACSWGVRRVQRRGRTAAINALPVTFVFTGREMQGQTLAAEALKNPGVIGSHGAVAVQLRALISDAASAVVGEMHL